MYDSADNQKLSNRADYSHVITLLFDSLDALDVLSDWLNVLQFIHIPFALIPLIMTAGHHSQLPQGSLNLENYSELQVLHHNLLDSVLV
jgi:hypothetical protein